jgi:hypothetical protein
LSPFSVRVLTTQSGRGILPVKAFQDGHSYVLRLWPPLSTRLQLELFFGFSEFVEGRNHPSLCTCFWGESLGRTLISTRRRHPPPVSICSWPSCCIHLSRCPPDARPRHAPTISVKFETMVACTTANPYRPNSPIRSPAHHPAQWPSPDSNLRHVCCTIGSRSGAACHSLRRGPEPKLPTDAGRPL